MADVLTRPKPVSIYPESNPADRPEWIPADIIADWNPSPYAYQTQEEQMPSGGAHGVLMGYIFAVLDHFLKRRDLMLLLGLWVGGAAGIRDSGKSRGLPGGEQLNQARTKRKDGYVNLTALWQVDCGPARSRGSAARRLAIITLHH